MRYSENLNLKIPEKTDHAKVEDISENFEVLDESIAGSTNRVTVLSSSDGEFYTAEVPGVKALVAGLRIYAVPEIGSINSNVHLDVNGLGSVPVMMRGSADTGSTFVPTFGGWLAQGAPVQLTYNGSVFVAEFMKTAAQDLDGVLPVEKGGHGGKTAAEARSNLGITPENIGAQKTVVGAASTVTSANLTAQRALVSNASGKISASSVTTEELSKLSGIDTNIKEKLDGKAEKQHSHSAGDITSGVMPVANGGTGRGSVKTGRFLVGDGTNALAEKSPAEVLTLIGAAANIHTHAVSDVIGAARIQHIYYTGTGTYGSNFPTKVTFEFTPMFVLIYSSYASRISTIIFGETSTVFLYANVTDAACPLSYGLNSMEWYNLKNSAQQFNSKGETYYCIAIG